VFAHCFLLFAGALCAGSLKLAEGGRSSCVIVRPADCGSNVRFAAFDLKRHLERMTGATFRIVDSASSCPAGCCTIEVGTERAYRLVGEARFSKLGRNGAAVVAAGNTVAICGKDKFGTVYGVYDFLEDRLGCRWYTPDFDHVPKVARLAVKPFESLKTPRLEYRWLMGPGHVWKDVKNASLWELRNKLNMAAWGGKYYENVDLPEGCAKLTTEMHTVGAYCHSLFNFIPPHGKFGLPAYYKLHPEWFSYSKTERRRLDTRQLCFSNAGMCSEFKRNFFAFVEKNGGAGCYNISAQDVGGHLCECEPCLGLERKYGAVGAPLFLFLREIALEMQSRWPRALLSTLVYRKDQTQTPPNGEFPGFPDNVVATFAPIDDDFSKDLSHAGNAGTYADLKRWCSLVKHVWPWYYPAPYTTFNPYSGVRRAAADVRLMIKAGITGSGYEHDVGMRQEANFHALTGWVLAKLFSDPSLDENELAREFCRRVYAAAGEDVYSYFAELEDLRESYGGRLAWNRSMNSIYTADNLLRWSEAFDRMEKKLEGDPAALARLKGVRLGLDECLLRNHLRLAKTKDVRLPAAETIYARMTNAIVAAGVRHGNSASKVVSSNPDLIVPQSLLLSASAASAGKPAEFAHVSDDDIRQVFLTDRGTGARRRPMPDASTGTAVWNDKEKPNRRKGFSICFYDSGNRKFLLDYFIPPSEWEPGRFKLYRVAQGFRLRPECLVAIGPSWYVNCPLNELFVPGSDDRWDVYVALKFEGEGYFPERKGERNRVALDRVVLVRAGVKPASAEKRKEKSK
jgi:hypothetical protein